MRPTFLLARVIAKCVLSLGALLLIFTGTAQSGNGPGEYPGAQGQPFQALQEQIDALEASFQAQLTSLQSALQALQQETQSLRDQIQAGFGDMGDLQARVTQNELTLLSLQAQINAIQITLAQKQNQIVSGCPSGSAIRQVFPNGSVLCEFDDQAHSFPIFGPGVGMAPNGVNGTAVSCPFPYRATSASHRGSPGARIIESFPGSTSTWVMVGFGDPAFGGGGFQPIVMCTRMEGIF